jgi:hypothetical protein
LQEFKPDPVPALHLEPGAVSLRAAPAAAKPHVAEMAWHPLDSDAAAKVAACAKHGDRAALDVRIARAQLDTARRLAVDWAASEVAVEVRAVLAHAIPHAPAGHIIVSEQFDVSGAAAAAVAAAMAAETRDSSEPGAAPGVGGAEDVLQVLLAARARQNGSIVVKAWRSDDVAQFYATRSGTETRAVIGALRDACQGYPRRHPNPFDMTVQPRFCPSKCFSPSRCLWL